MTPDEFAQEYLENHDRFVRYARKFVRDEATAEGLVVDTMLTLWKIHERIVAAAFRTLFYKWLRGNCLQYLRKRKRGREVEFIAGLHDAPSPDETASEERELETTEKLNFALHEVEAALREALPKLSQVERQAWVSNVVLRDSVAEGARSMRVTEGAYSNSLNRARNKLREVFDRRGIDYDLVPPSILATLYFEILRKDREGGASL